MILDFKEEKPKTIDIECNYKDMAIRCTFKNKLELSFKLSMEQFEKLRKQMNKITEGF